MVPTLFLGGNITLESVGIGLIMALLLVDMIMAFQLFNSHVSADSLISVMPKSFTSISMTGLIALRFVPVVLQDFNSIKEAQLSRGFKFNTGSHIKRIKNNLGLILPTLVTSLERGFNISESMASRGYTGNRTRFNSITWNRIDILIFTSCLIGLLISFYLSFNDSLSYWPYDSISLPELSYLAFVPPLILLLPLMKNEEHD